MLRWLGKLALLLAFGWGALLLSLRFKDSLPLGQYPFIAFAECGWVYAAAWLSLRPSDPFWGAVGVRCGVLLLPLVLMQVVLPIGLAVSWLLAHFGATHIVGLEGVLLVGPALVAAFGMAVLQHLTAPLTQSTCWPWVRQHLLGTAGSVALLCWFFTLEDRETARSWWSLVFLPHALLTAPLAARDAPALRSRDGLRAITPFLLLCLVCLTLAALLGRWPPALQGF